MDERMENLIRQWGLRGEGPAPVPGRPSDDCLTFPEAEQVARGQKPSREGVAAHVAACDRCRRLVADFREALAEGAPPAGKQMERGNRSPLILKLGGLAAAAAVLIAVGVGVLLYLHEPAGGPMLGDVEVGLQSYIESGLTPKGERVFADGDRIMFCVEVRQEAYLAVLNLDTRGRLAALPPKTASSNLFLRTEEGVARLGPYEVGGIPGREMVFIVTTRESVDDLPERVRRLQSVYDQAGEVEAVADAIRSWPAEVTVLSFEHVADR